MKMFIWIVVDFHLSNFLKGNRLVYLRTTPSNGHMTFLIGI